ncbi:MAG: alpha/beta hydrolase [Pseudomonadota bacterium]
MTQPVETNIAIGADEFAVYHWRGTGSPILLLHATGFHSRCWDEVVRRLPDRDIYAADLRFHGGSTRSGKVDWVGMGQDVSALITRLDLTDVLLVGHSIGGHLATRAAATQPERIRQLLLIDPVIMPPDIYASLGATLADSAAQDHPVSRRKNRWRDAQEMYQRFHDRAPFSTWDKAVLRDYCDYALQPADEAGWLQLACDPLNEASVYIASSRAGDIFQLLPQVSCPVTLLRAAAGEPMDLAASPTWAGLASALPDCREHYLPDMNHFIPMCDPGLVARHICEMIGSG